MADEGTVLDPHHKGSSRGTQRGSRPSAGRRFAHRCRYKRAVPRHAGAGPAGDSVLAQAAAFRASGLSEEEAASALRNLGISAAHAEEAISQLSSISAEVSEEVSNYFARMAAGLEDAGKSAQDATQKIGQGAEDAEKRVGAATSGIRGRPDRHK